LSKFSERLASLGQTAPARLGFGRAAARDKTPVMLLVGRSSEVRDINGIVDALLLPPAVVGNVNDGSPMWGVSSTDGAQLSIDELKSKDCQFVLIESDKSSASLLVDEDVCRGLVIESGLPDQRIRAVEDGPFEFLLYRPESVSWPLTVGAVLSLQEVVSNFSKHIFLEVSDLPENSDLEVLKHMPVSALVVDLDTVSADRVKSLKQAIEKLEPRKHRQERTPLIPASGRSSADDYEPDEDDYDDWEDE
jgi:hypothetical protein